MLDVSVSFERKQAVVQFEPGKIRLGQILKRYASTPFDVSLAGPVTTVVRQEKATVRAWADPAKLVNMTVEGEEPSSAVLFIEFVPAGEYQIDAPPSLSLSKTLSEPVWTLVREIAEINASDARPPLGPSARRFALALRLQGRTETGELPVPLEFRYAVLDRHGNQHDGAGSVPILLEVAAREGQSPKTPVSTGVALVGGVLEFGLGHLCDQTGCVDHFYQSLGSLPWPVGVRPRPSLDEPRASVFVQAGQAIDVWGLRELLRDRGIELRRLVPRDMGGFQLHVELSRWHVADAANNPSQCRSCRERTLAAVQSLAWTSEAALVGAGVTVRTRQVDADLCTPLDKLEAAGIVPLAVWLVPDGVAMPKPAPSRTAARSAAPKIGGSAAHPLIQFDFSHHCTGGAGILKQLGDQEWVSRSGVAQVNLGAIDDRHLLPGVLAVAAVDDRRRADLATLFRALRGDGWRPTQTRLSNFGDLRVQFEFAHLCGDVEYSKPPKQEVKESADSLPADTKKDEKPFVPKPLRPAATSNARQAIERAVARATWVSDGTYLDYHTKPEFDGPRKMIIALRPAGDGIVRLDDLTRALTRAGFPPTAVRVSRLFPGIPFGHGLPVDLELETADGAKRPLASFRRDGRPLVVAFVSLYCPLWEKYAYEAEPKHFAKLKQSIESFQDRVDFVAVSSNPNDKLVEVAQCLGGAAVRIPLLNDRDEIARAVLNAQITPPPHIFIFDAGGLLRYAGDPHSNWNKPDDEQGDFLGPALNAVLAGKYADNRAVSFHSSKCNCSSPNCKCPKCGCGPSCRCDIGH